MKLIDQLLVDARPFFTEFRKLNAKCPKCAAQMILKFAQGKKEQGRRLPIIMCCIKNCDRKIWNTDSNPTDFTHWWLDGSRNREGYEKIMESLPIEEAKLVRGLEIDLRRVNSDFVESSKL